MKVNPVKLKKIIQKSSFNYRLDGTRIHFTTDKISSSMISPDHTFAALIEVNNDVLTGIRRQTGYVINFDIKNKLFSKRAFHQFDSDECDARITTNNFFISEESQETRFAFTDCENIVLNRDSLPIFNQTSKTTMQIDDDFIKRVLRYCKTAQQTKVNEIKYKVEDGNSYLCIEKESGTEASMGLSGTIVGNPNNGISIPFNRVDLKEVFRLIKMEKDKEYKIDFVYDDSKLYGYASVESLDGTEQYILFSKRENSSGEVIDIRTHHYETTPQIPDTWNYDESVQKVKTNIYTWKNLTQEIFTELWIARSILSQSKSEAAKIMHGTLVPWMTWTQYCEDIGSSRQVVNRWLKQAFDSKLLEGESESSVLDEFFKLARKVVGRSERKIVDAYNGRTAPDQIEKLLQDIESGKTDEAIVHVNNKYTYREWFKPLFDGYICFANDPQGSCFVYFGDKRDEFASEFSQHGVVMAKVGT